MIDYTKNEEIMKLFKTKSIKIKKKSVTLGRLPNDSEIGKILKTYVKCYSGQIKLETKNKITDDVVIAKNPKPLGIVNGEIIFNEWLIPKDIWNKNYGFKVDNVQKEYKKIKTINAIKITDDVLLKLGSKNGLTARIKVNFSENGMVVYKGGLLTDQGYGIAPQELKDTYNLI